MYRFSKYVVRLPDFESQGDLIIFSGRTGNVIRMPEAVYAMLKRIMKRKVKSNILHSLIEVEFIVLDGEPEKASIDSQRSFEILEEQNWSSFSVMPTLRCNHQCSYCYQSHPNIDMDAKTCSSALQWIENHSSENREGQFDFRFFGGEPLLRTDLIVWFVEAIRKQCDGLNWTPLFTLISTLIPLDKKIIDLFSCGDLSNVLVTLDGPKNIHETRRRFKQSSESNYDLTMNGIHRILEKTDNLTIRINLDRENITSLEALLDDLAFLLKEKNIRVEPTPVADVRPDLNRKICYSQKDWARMYPEIVSIIQDFGFKINFPHMRFFHTGLKGCNAYSMARPIITPSGEIYFCDYMTTVPEYSCGNIFDGLNEESIKSRISESTCSQGCNDCALVFLCGGPCLPFIDQQDGCKPVKYLAE